MTRAKKVSPAKSTYSSGKVVPAKATPGKITPGKTAGKTVPAKATLGKPAGKVVPAKAAKSVPPKNVGKTFVLKIDNPIQTIVSRLVSVPKNTRIETENQGTMPQTFINLDPEVRSSTFLDIRKIKTRIWGGMVYPGNKTYSYGHNCWWCRHSSKTIENTPVGCPLSKVDGTFVVEGGFCSFPCVKAYILDKRLIPKYKNSLSLLSELYMAATNQEPTFAAAPSWKMLREYGGHLTLKEFRISFGDAPYFTETANVTMSPVSQITIETH